MSERTVCNRICSGFQEKKTYLYLLISSLALRQLMLGGTAVMRCAKDDIGYISAAMYLAGYDWSGVMGEIPYYGAGYYVLFTPLIKLISSPTALWWVLSEANVLCMVIATLLAYRFAVRKMHMESGWKTIACVLLCSCCVINGGVMSAEPVIFLLTWILICMLSCLQFDVSGCGFTRKNLILIPAAAVILLYAYLCHSRNLVFFAAFPITVILVSLAYRNWKSMICLGAYTGLWEIIFYKISVTAQSAILDTIYLAAERESSSVRNANVGVQGILEKLTSFRVLRVCFDAFISNVLTAMFSTYGLVIVTVLLFFLFLFGILHKKCILHMGKNDWMALAFSTVCFLMGIVGVALKIGSLSESTYWGPFDNSNYKGFFYFRYYGTYLGPALLVALKYIQKNKIREVRLLKILTTLAAVGIPLYCIFVVFGNLGNKQYINQLSGLFNYEGEGIDWQNIIVMIAIICILEYILFYTKIKSQYAIAVMVVCLWIPYIGNGFVYTPTTDETYDSGCDVIRLLEANNLLPEYIYITQTTPACYYQYILRDLTIYIGTPEIMGDDNLVLSAGEEELQGYYCIILDQDSYLYTTDAEVYDFLMESEYESGE